MDNNFGGGNLLKLIQENQKANQGFQQEKVDYPNPPVSMDEQINAMPNSEKLSGFERWVYKKLPGVSNSKFGKLLETFANSPVGAALNKLDVLAEGFERIGGTVAQARYLEPGEDFDLKDAWSAGSLYYDVSNLPTTGPNGVEIESDLPGTYALVEARKMISEGKSLEEVRDTLYNNLGALKLRAQLQDTMGHVLADPLNFATAAVKPISKLTAIRNLALAGKVDVQAATKIAETLRTAGKLDDALKVENAIADVQKTGKALTKLDKAVINVFGGAAYLDDKSKLGKFFGSKYNPMALTNESKAHELVDMVEKNVHAYLINNSDNPEDFIRNLESIAKGSVGGEWGHIALTPQGRVVQGVFNQADASVKALGQEWKLYTQEREALEMIADALKMDANKVWKMANDNPEELSMLLGRATQEGLLQVVNPKTIEALSSIPSGVVSKEKFFANASALVEDSAAKIGIAKFGIDKKKFITRLSDTVKKYETMAFIKLNPANAVRNAINNEVTMVARGLHGITPAQVKAYWKDKAIPAIFQRGFNVAGDGLEEEFDFAAKTFSKALNGEGNRDFLGKAAQFADDFNLGVADVSKLSQKAEAGASLRASTNAYIEFGDKYWNTQTGFTSARKYLDPDVIDELDAIDPALVDILDDAIQSTAGNSKKLKEVLEMSLESNSTSVFKAVEDNLGYKVEDVLGPELSAQIHEGLPKAIREGTVPQFVDGVRKQMEDHVDAMFDKHIENLPGITANYVQAGGPTQFSRIYAKAMDEFWAGNTEHAIRMSTINELIDYAKRTGDYKKVNSLWGKIMQDGQNHFSRVWKKMDAYEQGMKEGARLAGIPYPKQLSEGFSGMKKGWQEFFDTRNDEYSRFFSSDLKGAEATNEFNRIQNQLNSAYEKMIRQEDALYSQIDDALANAIPDKQMRAMYKRQRGMAADLREQDRRATAKFYNEIRGMESDEYPAAWQKYWQEKSARIAQMRDIERRGSAALQGDAQAIQQFAAGQTPAPDATTVRGLANQFGIATQTDKGVRLDNRVLSTIRKYGDATDRQIVENARLPEEVKTAFGTWDDAKLALEQIEAENAGKFDTDATNLIKAAKKSEKEARKAYEEVLTANRIDKKAIQKLVKSKEFMDLENIPLDVAKRAFEKRALEKAEPVQEAVDKYFLPDVEKMWPEQMPIETAISELNYGRSYAVMDTVVEEALEQAKLKSHKISELPEHLQAKVTNWIDNARAESTAFESARIEYAKMRRDSALLNYNRRNNFDNFVGHIAPFGFWTTHSMANWAVHSLDHSAMLTSYMRYQKLLETSGLENNELPSRMKGHLRINTPFAPSWMGEQFFNPVGVALPFDAWQQPWEQVQRTKFSAEGRALRTLDDMLEKGVISQQQYKEAVDTRSGSAWDMAMSKAQEGGDNYDAFDFGQALMTPHAPLMWAFNAARGTPNEIGPFTPLSRTTKNVASMLGVKDWGNSPYNVEGRIRKEMGLPAYDRWDDYRVGREISNMAADGDYDMEQVRQAMELAAQVEAGKLDPQQAAKMSELYEEAVHRSNIEAAGGWTGTVLGALGIPIKSYPTGEQEQRRLGEQFGKAIEASKNGDEEALTKFFDEHPEYESRLALFKKPEERLKMFMIDNMWSRWNELPKVNQDEIKEQLGDSFANKFLSKDTRNYDAITPQQLQIWLKMTGGKNVGELSATENALIELNQLKLTSPETAFRVQTFYDMRNEKHPDWYELQNDYYALPEGAQRKKFVAENPELKAYWNDRQKWMQTNPDLVRFLTDDEKQLRKYENVRRNPEVAVPTAEEIQANISPENMELINEWSSGQRLPLSTDRILEMLAMQYGIPKRNLLGILTGR